MESRPVWGKLAYDGVMTQSPYGQNSYDPAASGQQYPSAGSAYPSNGSAYPSNGSAYPSNGSTNPSNGSAYPGTGSSYPSADPGYPPAQPAQPENPAAHPSSAYPSAPSYPSAPGYQEGSSFPSAPAYPSAPGYPESSSYPAAPAYPSGPMPTYGAPVPAKKSPVLGIIGLAVVVVAAVIFYILSFNLYATIFQSIPYDQLASGSIDTVEMLENLPQSAIDQIGGTTAGLFGISIVGIVGWVLSIVATVQNKGRVFGIIGIVAGVIAPFLFFVAASAAIGSAI